MNILYIATRGFEDPTHATLPFVFAKGAIEAGYDVAILFATESVTLVNDAIRAEVKGLGFEPLDTFIDFMREHNVPIYVCGGCAKARGIVAADYDGKDNFFQMPFVSPVEVAKLVAAADKVVTL